MNALSQARPNAISEEKPAKTIASLTVTPALRQLAAVVVAQWENRDRFDELEQYGIRPIDRMLLYGPPGNGKTVACQWLAKQLGVQMYRVRCEGLVDAYVGRTAQNVSAVMQWLEKQNECLVLFDEIESIFPARSASAGVVGREISSAMTVFWQFMDRWESPTLFALATNMPETLDPALLSRIELKMSFGPPTREQAEAVIGYWAETLHEYGADKWGPELLRIANRGQGFESFRALFQHVQSHAREFVTQSITRNSEGTPP